jgi:protein-disulfide isomerase
MNEANLLCEAVTEADHAVGPADAAITIVEYGDYECPDCLNAFPIMEEVRKRLGGRMRFVFRHFPQSSIHPRASAAAEAAEAAGEQGKFWEMHASLFAHQAELDTMDLSHLALSLGLEIYKFEGGQSVERHLKRIRADFEGGVRCGVNKTPTLFINGKRYDGVVEAGAILEAVSGLG